MDMYPFNALNSDYFPKSKESNKTDGDDNHRVKDKYNWSSVQMGVAFSSYTQQITGPFN